MTTGSRARSRRGGSCRLPVLPAASGLLKGAAAGPETEGGREIMTVAAASSVGPGLGSPRPSGSGPRGNSCARRSARARRGARVGPNRPISSTCTADALGRRRGSASSIRESRASRPGRRPARRVEGAGNGPARTTESCSLTLFWGKSRRPVSISQSTTPSAHTSAGGPTAPPLSCSGAMVARWPSMG